MLESEAVVTSAYHDRFGSSNTVILVVTADRTVGICLVVRSLIAVMSANCWSPPEADMSFNCESCDHAVIRRIDPVPVPAGYFAVPNVITPSSVMLLVLTLLYGFFFGWRRIKVKTTTCTSSLLPQEFDGYRILQMSDLHIGTFRGKSSFISKLVKIVNAQRPDLIVFTGDLVNVRAEELHPFISELSKLSAVDGVFSVMGNHDYCEYGQDHRSKKISGRNH